MNSWLELGDRCTHFFHIFAKINTAINNIFSLMIDDEAVEHEEIIANHVVSYYKNLYKKGVVIQNNLISSVIDPLVTKEQNESLCVMPTEKEIFETICAMNHGGAPGSDGFGGIFFKTFCHIIKFDLIASVKFFFATGELRDIFNSVHVCLILKVKGADRVELFRPIALANFQFKIITKILADRLAPIASEIVSRYQSAFIKVEIFQIVVYY